MVRHEYFDDAGLRVLKAWEPFSLDELLAAGREAIAAGGPEELGKPTVFDLREIDMGQLDAQQFQSLLARRRVMAQEAGDNPGAFVVRDQSAFGMVRMYAAYAEFSGLREAENVWIGYDLSSAFAWIAGHLPASALPVLDTILTTVEAWSRLVG